MGLKNSSRKKLLVLDELPEVLTPQHCADYLRISRRRVYEFCQLTPEAGGIPSWRIGASWKIDKEDLIRWKEDQKKARQSTG
jgi:excisionase family DNA binding protein